MNETPSAGPAGSWLRRAIAVFFTTGVQRRLRGWLGAAVTAFAALVAALTFYAALFAFVDVYLLSAMFLSAMLGLAFLQVGAAAWSNPNRPSFLDVVLSATSIAAGIHIFIHREEIVTRIANLDALSVADVFFGTAFVFLTLEGTRRVVGLGLVVVVALFLSYNLFGHRLGGAWGHGGIEFDQFIDLLAFTTDGIFGLPTRVAATYAFLFVMFGTFLSRAGGGDFFFTIAAAATGKSPGGPAKIAVVSSGLFGMISGSPASDVVTTGSVTIPIMRRVGYSERFAGGVEVAASTGGSLAPPVMGSAAFIMVELTGISYRDIAIAAIIPALLYYFSIYAQVHLRSLKLGLAGLNPQDRASFRSSLGQAPIFIVPLVILVTMLLAGYSPTLVAAVASISVFVTALFSGRTRIGLIGLYQCLAETTLRMVPATAAIACAGLVIVGVNMTGLASKIAFLVFSITERDVFMSLVLSALITLVLGLGMPTPSAYLLAAVLMGPLLVELQIPLLAAHLFLLYYALMSAMTPPVATAAYVAASIARANPVQIALTACRLSIVAFLLPFAFVYSQGLLLVGNPADIVVDVVTATAGVVLIAIAVEGYLRGIIRWWLRLPFGAAGLCLFMPGLWTDLIGAAVASATFAAAFFAARKVADRAEQEAP
nr:TRAP transporter fused permease subunit [Nitrosomonas nitrosa]